MPCRIIHRTERFCSKERIIAMAAPKPNPVDAASPLSTLGRFYSLRASFQPHPTDHLVAILVRSATHLAPASHYQFPETLYLIFRGCFPASGLPLPESPNFTLLSPTWIQTSFSPTSAS